MILKYKGNEYKTGDSIIATIKNVMIFGKLNIQRNGNFLCHNDSDFSGSVSDDMQGFKFSWYFDIQSNGTFSDEVEIIGFDKNPILEKSIFSISEKLLSFFVNQNIKYTFLKKSNIFPEYDTFEISDTKGMVKLTGDSIKFGVIKGRKSTELKFGRFLNAYTKQVLDLCVLDLEFDNKIIEKTHNNFLSYQSGDCISVETITGSAILEAYKRENYSLNKSSLGGSCMSDKLEFLNLYKQNPDVISMIVVKMFDKIAGRALLWNLKDGTKVMEKSYICDEWVGAKFNEIRKENKYLNYLEEDKDGNTIKREVYINIEGIEKWPYMDTFCYMVKSESGKKAKLFNTTPTGKSTVLRSTDGLDSGVTTNNGKDIIVEDIEYNSKIRNIIHKLERKITKKLRVI
jgi:hypothetical protein